MARDEPRLPPWNGIAAAVTFSGGVYFSPRLQNRSRNTPPLLQWKCVATAVTFSDGGHFRPLPNSTTWTCSRMPAIRLPYCGRHASPPPSLSPVGVFLAPAKDSMLQARTRGHATRPASRSRHASSPPSLSPVGVFLAPSKDRARDTPRLPRPMRVVTAATFSDGGTCGSCAGRSHTGVDGTHGALPAAARCSPDSTLSVIARAGRGRQSARTECTHAARVPLWCEFGPNIARVAALHEKDGRHGRDGPVPTRCAPAQCSHGAPADAAGNAAAVSLFSPPPFLSLSPPLWTGAVCSTDRRRAARLAHEAHPVCETYGLRTECTPRRVARARLAQSTPHVESRVRQLIYRVGLLHVAASSSSGVRRGVAARADQ
ncbi:hypothetical protein C8J57DRAFT_1492204 [Mycena rebaudengoi]|nr:hypothetical protein C8J57DRAFT_1492204 [Mycena rebaudengoi]